MREAGAGPKQILEALLFAADPALSEAERAMIATSVPFVAYTPSALRCHSV